MKKRVIAWILLASFVLLLLNLIIFRFYWQLSMGVYIIIVIAFVLTNGRLFEAQGDDEPENLENNNDNDVVGGGSADIEGNKED